MTTLIPFSVDSYLPAVPEIADHFKTTAATISFSLSAFFGGFAIGQIIYGPLLDRFGRKTPLYFGISISILSSMACILSGNEIVFMVFRFVQALGASVATVAAITMVRDFFTQEQSAKVFSLLVLVIGTSPLLAPTIGGAISANLGWQWIFVFLSVLGFLLMWIIYAFLPVKYKADPDISLKIKHQTVRYISIIKKSQFSVFAIAGAFSFCFTFYLCYRFSDYIHTGLSYQSAGFRWNLCFAVSRIYRRQPAEYFIPAKIYKPANISYRFIHTGDSLPYIFVGRTEQLVWRNIYNCVTLYFTYLSWFYFSQCNSVGS